MYPAFCCGLLCPVPMMSCVAFRPFRTPLNRVAAQAVCSHGQTSLLFERRIVGVSSRFPDSRCQRFDRYGRLRESPC